MSRGLFSVVLTEVLWFLANSSCRVGTVVVIPFGLTGVVKRWMWLEMILFVVVVNWWVVGLLSVIYSSSSVSWYCWVVLICFGGECWSFHVTDLSLNGVYSNIYCLLLLISPVRVIDLLNVLLKVVPLALCPLSSICFPSSVVTSFFAEVAYYCSIIP